MVRISSTITTEATLLQYPLHNAKPLVRLKVLRERERDRETERERERSPKQLAQCLCSSTRTPTHVVKLLKNFVVFRVPPQEQCFKEEAGLRHYSLGDDCSMLRERERKRERERERECVCVCKKATMNLHIDILCKQCSQ